MASSRSLGTLTLDLIAKIGGFTDALSKAGRQTQDSLNKIEKRFSSFGDNVENILGAIGIGVGLKELVDTITNSISKMDELGKSAAKVGLPIEQFSALAAAAQLSNVNIDTLQTTLGKLSKTEATALNPLSQQSQIFKALGINIKDVNGNLKPATDIMEEFADKFQKLGTNSTTVAAGIALFGKNFQDLIPFLSKGSEGIAAAQQEAIDLGATLTGPAADAAAQFEDNLNKIKLAGQGITNQLVQALLPSLNEWTGDVVDLAKDHSELQGIASTLSNTLHVLAAAAIEVGAGFKVITAAVETVVIAVANAARGIATLYEAASKQTFSLNPITNFKNGLAAWKDAYKQLESNSTAARDTVSDIWSSAGDTLSKALDAAKKQIAEVGNSTAPITNATAAVVQLSKSVNDIASAGVKTQGGLTKAIKQIGDLGAAAIKSGENIQEVQSVVARGVAKLNAAFGNQDALKKLQSALNPAAAQQAEKQAQAYQALADAVASVTASVDPSQKALADEEATIRKLGELAGAAIKAGSDVKQVQELLAKGIAGAQQKYVEAIAAPMKAAQAYSDALAQQLKAQKAANDEAAAAVGMGSKQAAQQAQLNKVVQDGAQAVADFTRKYSKQLGANDPQYTSELSALEDYWSNVLKVTKQGQADLNAAQANWINGLKGGFTDWMNQAADVADQWRDITKNALDTATDDLADFIDGSKSAKDAFSDFITSTEAAITKFVAQQLLKKLLDSLFNTGDTAGNGSGSSGSWIASLIGGIFGGGGSGGVAANWSGPRAGGGTVPMNSFSRVNERGPELLSVGGKDYLMMGPQTGRVTPNSAIPQRSGASVQNNFYMSAPTSMRTQTQVANKTAYELRRASRLS